MVVMMMIPMLVIVEGMVTDVSAVHAEKAPGAYGYG